MSNDAAKKFLADLINKAIREQQYEKFLEGLKEYDRVNAVRKRLLDSINEEAKPKK